jgi:hypothetical protein
VNQFQHNSPRTGRSLQFPNAYLSPDTRLAYNAAPIPQIDSRPKPELRDIPSFTPITKIQSTATSSQHPSRRLPWSPDSRTMHAIASQIVQQAIPTPQPAIVNRAIPNRPIMGQTPWHTIDESMQCFVCLKDHAPGRCPLRDTKTETCPACGYHHLHSRKACPLLQDPGYIDAMYRRLNESTEDMQVVRAARLYLAGIKGNLSQQNRRK